MTYQLIRVDCVIPKSSKMFRTFQGRFQSILVAFQLEKWHDDPPIAHIDSYVSRGLKHINWIWLNIVLTCSYFFPDSLGILSFSSSFEAASSPTSVKFHLRSLGTTVPREGSVDPRLHCWNSFVETPGFQGKNMFFFVQLLVWSIRFSFSLTWEKDPHLHVLVGRKHGRPGVFSHPRCNLVGSTQNRWTLEAGLQQRQNGPSLVGLW